MLSNSYLLKKASKATKYLQVNRFVVYSLIWDTFQVLDTFEEQNREENKK